MEILVLCILITLAGTFTGVEMEEAQKLSQEINNLRDCVKSVGFQLIFGNNFMHALIMFVPIAGPFWGFFTLYSTGRIIAALSMVNKINPALLAFTLFLFPFTWMEYISYALAISESLILTYSVVKRNLRKEFITASKLFVFCSVILLIAAIIEFYMISLLEVPLKI
ncbi:MAG: stage II sporulation protein M [Candidatus Bathyarchaeia archaeon]